MVSGASCMVLFIGRASRAPGSLAGGSRAFLPARVSWPALARSGSTSGRTQCARSRTPPRRTEGADADTLYLALAEWAGEQGLSLYPPRRRRCSAARRRQRGAGDADRVGEVAGGDRGSPGGARRRAASLLHRADQGAGQREVLRALRGVRRRRRRDADRRRQRQRRSPDHRLHRGGAREHRAARGRPCRRRAGRDGRVPLLRRAGPWLGLAGAAARAAAGPVRADVGDARRHVRDRRRPDAAHRPRDRRGRRRRAARPASFGWSLEPLDETVEELVTTGQAPAYVVHFTQAPPSSTRPGCGRRRRQIDRSGRTRSLRRSGRSGSARGSARRCRSW